MPGLESVEILEPGKAFGGTARVGVGSLEVEFPARVEWVEQHALEGGRLRALAEVAGYEIAGEGTLSLADAEATADGPPGTHVTWSATVVLPEALAQNPVSAQMVKTVAGRFIKNFFECIQTRLISV